MSDTAQRCMPLVCENQRSQRRCRRYQPLPESFREAIPGAIASGLWERLTASGKDDAPCPQRRTIGEIDREHTVRSCQPDDAAAGVDGDLTPSGFGKQAVEHGA